MRAVALALLLGGCSPLGAYVHALPYGKELFAKDPVAETYARFAEVERREAGYPHSKQEVPFPVRNAVPRKPRTSVK